MRTEAVKTLEVFISKGQEQVVISKLASVIAKSENTDLSRLIRAGVLTVDAVRPTELSAYRSLYAR